MGDHRAGPTGTMADPQTTPLAGPGGKRVARHALEQRTSQPYVGRRVAGQVAGRRIATSAGQPTTPTTTPATYVGRRVAPSPIAELETPVVPRIRFTIVEAPAVQAPVVQAPVVPIPVETPAADGVQPVRAEPAPTTSAPPPRRTRPPGARVARRRTRVPSVPLLAGVAVLAISAGGALQAMHPGLPGADTDGRLSAASALSGSGVFGTADLSGRGTSVSRDSDRQAISPTALQAAANAQAQQRDQVLTSLRGKAEKQAAQIKLHRWVLPITPGVYHLTARFGDYSYLWANFHTGLDFAAPTGTPIMAVAGGTITEVGYSGAYGNRTIEKLPDGTELWYCHQNEFGTQVGAKVKPGQVIGYVGSTGNVTGPHLHLEVHPHGGDAVDPYPVLVAHGLYPGPPA